MRSGAARLFGLQARRGGAAAAAPAFDPDTLFASGEAGGWYDPSDLSTLWQDTAGTVAVTADGDSVARMDDKSGNGNHWTQATAGLRPVYKTDGTLHWLLLDRVDDWMAIAGLNLNGATWDFGMAYVPDATGFILIGDDNSADPWVGIGQSGSSSTALHSRAPQNAFYVDDVLSNETTRGGQYTLVQAGNRTLVNFSPSAIMNPRFGRYQSSTFFAPGPVYAMILRQGTMDATQRSDWDGFAAAAVGV